MRLIYLVPLAFLSFVPLALARKKDHPPDPTTAGFGQPAASVSDIPALASLLERAGWEPTPELSGSFRAGSIFLVSDMGHRVVERNCFTVQPMENTYTQTELITQLQAGVSVRVGAAGEISGSTEIVKKVKFGTPTHTTIDLNALIPTTACRARLQQAPSRGLDLSRMYVVQEVLSALITEQTCGRVDASGRFVMLGQADVEASMACQQASLDPVAVGYRTMPIIQILGPGATATPVSRSTVSATAPQPASRGTASLVHTDQGQGCPRPDASAMNLLTPSGFVTEIQPTFAWTAATNMNSSADTYEFYLWDAADNSHPTYYPVNVSSTAWKMDMGNLRRGHRYCWKLRPKNQCGTGGYAGEMCFSVQ